MASPKATINDPNAPVATGGAKAPSYLSKTLKQRARARLARGDGGAATYARLGKKPPQTKAATPSAPQPQGYQLDPTTKSLIDAAVRIKFGDQETALGQQLNSNARFSSAAPSWYASAISQIKGQQQAVPPPTMPAPTGDPAQDSRNAAAFAYQQQHAGQLTAGNQFLDSVAAGLQAAQGNTLNAANAQRQQILGQQAALKGDEGAFRVSQLNDMNAAQAKAIMDKAKIDASLAIAQGKYDLAAQQLKVSQQLADSLVSDRNFNNQLAATDPNRAKTQADLDFFNKHGYYPPTGPPKKGKGANGGTFTRTQGETNAHHKVIRDVNNALSDVQDLRNQGFSDKAVKGALRKNHVPTDILDAAFTLANDDYLTGAQIKALKLAGLIAPPSGWKVPKLKVILPKDRPR